MIEIKNLTKVYKTSFNESTVAINDISLTLPHTGLVFVIGKSGSGKSTLLNMIGALDNITSGDIIVDGKSLKNSTEKELQEYRSSYLGFIFQDFLLLNEFTVAENINLALNISGIDDDSLIDDVLEMVDLTNEKDKLPAELSGGQRQRVAIARALVKNPKMLLCDEPTGNLDYKTSAFILNFLKEQSKNKLVIIVSHNLEDAEIYGDRIIELFDGEIVSDTSKNPNYINEYIESDEQVILPHHKDMTSNEVERLNNLIKVSKPTIIQNKSGFEPTPIINETPNDFKLSSSFLSMKNRNKISSIFFKKNKHGTPYTIIMLTLFISLLYIFQAFVLFNGNNSLPKPDEDLPIRIIKTSENTIIGTLATSNIYTVTDDEINKFYENGYEGNVFSVYNYGFTMNHNYALGGKLNRFVSTLDYNYLKETTGTICCDEEFLVNLYGKDGQLEVLCGTLKDAKHKLIITDYVAKCLINYAPSTLKTYDDVYKKYNNKIAAIINTDFEERYPNVIMHEKQALEKGLSSVEYINTYSIDKEHISFLNEVQNYLGLCYCFQDSNKFLDEVVNINSVSSSYNYFYAESEFTSKVLYDESWAIRKDNTNKYKLNDNEIIMSFALYKSLFGKEYTMFTANSFTPHTMKLTKYANITDDSSVIFEQEYLIKAVADASYMNNYTYETLIKSKIFTFSLCFNNNSNEDIIYDVMKDSNFMIYQVDTTIVPIVNTIIDLFRGFCILIIVLLVIVCVIYIIIYGIGSIKKNLFEIGVLKALGAKSFDIAIIFISQILIVSVCVIIVSILGVELLSILTNRILIRAFEDFITIKIFELSIIKARPKLMAIDLSLVFVGALVSSAIPLFYLRKVKPLNILKGKKK